MRLIEKKMNRILNSMDIRWTWFSQAVFMQTSEVLLRQAKSTTVIPVEDTIDSNIDLEFAISQIIDERRWNYRLIFLKVIQL